MERDAIREELEQAIKDFNSHAHVERDFDEQGEWACSAISTHTLTWSVTHSLHLKRMGSQDFNSHAHVERDSVMLFEFRTY